MKKYFYTPVLVALLTSFMTLRAQDRQEYLGLPGDNLNLFAVMKLFQESETLEGFERNLNDENSRINNLDLNGDSYVDYIRVIDNVDRNVHFIVLQVAVSPRENQDVAVFTVVQESNGAVAIQLVGDEALYGRDYIVEPIFDETPNPGYTGRATRLNNDRVTVVRTTTYEIAAWPVIRFMFMPTYVVWHSPWHWDYYPNYWRPWNSYYWHYYYGYHYNYYNYYYGHYRHWDHHRYDYWHDTYYTHHHVHSPYVHSRISDGYYKRTYSRPEQRKDGEALYRRTRSAESPRTSVGTSGGRRTSTGSGTINQPKNTSGSREATSPTRSTGTRQSTGTGTRQSTSPATRSTSSGTRQSATTNEGRRSTATDANRESATRSTESRPSGSATRQSASPNTTKRTTATGNTRESRSSSSGQSTSRSTGERSSGTVNKSDRRSGNNSSGSSSRSEEESGSSKSTRSSGRR